MKHIIEVLTGADTEKIRNWQHHELSTYGIGKDCSRKEWAAIGRELVRLGFLALSTGKFSVVMLTEAGANALRERQTVLLTQQPEEIKKSKTTDSFQYDEILFERLRRLRKNMADDREIPAYMIFSDVSLRQMARNYPSDEREFARIGGVGQKKLEEFSGTFLAEIAAYLQENPRRAFTADAVLPAHTPRLNQTSRETLQRFRNGESVADIARARGLVPGTIYGHLTEACSAGEQMDLNCFFTSEEQKKLEDAFARIGFANLTGVYDLLAGKFDYGLLRLYRCLAQRPRNVLDKI